MDPEFHLGANDLRFGWNHYDRLVNIADYQTPATSYGINSGVTASNLQGLPTINVSGFSELGGDSKTPKEFGPGSDYDLVDHVSYLRGKHAFKFGGEALFYNANDDQVSSGRGIFTFSGGQTAGTIASLTPLESFLAGDPTHATLLEGDPARTFSEWDFSGFFEDSWRATQKVTVNMGLRYEYYTPLSEKNNLIGSFSPQVGFEQQGVNISHPYNADPKISLRGSALPGTSRKRYHRSPRRLRLCYTQIITQQLVGDTSLPGNNPGISSIPTATPRICQTERLRLR